MSEHTLYGKRKLCYTEVTDFTDFQGVGRDPLYKRYDTVYSVIDKYMAPQYKDFLAHPIYSDEDQILWYVREWEGTPSRLNDLSGLEREKYSIIKEKTIAEYQKLQKSLSGEDKQIITGAIRYIDDDFIFCYDDKVVLVAWGMVADSNKYLVKGTVMHDLKLQTSHKVTFDVGEGGTLRDKFAGLVSRPDGAVLRERDLPAVFAKEGYTFTGWNPEPIGVKVNGPLTFTAMYEKAEEPEIETIRVSFMESEGGILNGATELIIDKGSYLDTMQIPEVSTYDGYVFIGWDKDMSAQLNEDTVFCALFERNEVKCVFDAGDHGQVLGDSEFYVLSGSVLDASMVPGIKPDKKYNFIGWNKEPAGFPLDQDTTFVAQYEKELPWYKKLWRFLTGKGCLKWLLWILLLLLLLWGLSWLLRSCEPEHDAPIIEQSRKIETPSGRIIDDNGPIRPVIGDDGKLPDDVNIVAPIVGDDGIDPPIISNPGLPDIVGNRLVIFFDDADVDLEKFISDLGRLYPKEVCEAIGYDRNIPMITLMVAEDQRDRIRESLNAQLPGYDFFILDESIFELGEFTTRTAGRAGWHLDAIDLAEGWEISKGDSEVIVAVVDDGLDASHEMFKGRIVSPYNVFTQNNRLSTGEGHGTHVAGLAVGSDRRFSEGASGVAPNCKLMPVQVFDNEICTFSSLASGIIYAIHHGADVINVSVGPNFSGMDILPPSEQERIANNNFKNEERVWRRIISIANENNAIIVFAVGNDNILASIPPENRTNMTVNVAAVDSDITPTEFTNYSTGANISAPGQDIYSSVPVNDYEMMNGTSMAAPIVTGTIALMKSCKPDITVTEVLYYLQETGEEVSSSMPPMIQVDDVLIALTTGKFPDRAKKETGKAPRPAPSPSPKPAPVPAPGKSPVTSPGKSPVTSPVKSPVTTPVTSPVYDDGTCIGGGSDYADIRELIEAYKRRIRELERLLPENQ